MPISIDQPKSIRDSTHAMRIAMRTTHIHRHDDEENEDLNDMIPEALMLGFISLSATYLAMGGSPDLLCVPGAMLGAVVALLKATQEKRPWTDKSILIIGSSVVGTTVPTAAVHMFWPEWLEKLTWHVYFFAAFIFSIIGWMLIWPFILALDARRERIAKKAMDELERRFGVSPRDGDDGRGNRP